MPVPERGNELGLVLAQDHSDAVGDGPLAVPTCSLLKFPISYRPYLKNNNILMKVMEKIPLGEKKTRYSYKTFFHKTSRHETSSNKTSRLQNVLAYKTSQLKFLFNTLTHYQDIIIKLFLIFLTLRAFIAF
jgi:hypothetical protein